MGFLGRAMKVLETNLGKKYCYQCWGQAAGMTSWEELQKLSCLGTTFVKAPDRIAVNGICDMCGKYKWTASKLS